MDFDISQEQQEFIERSIRSGRFASPDAAINEALHLLLERELELEQLRAAVPAADADYETGNYRDYGLEDSSKLVDEVVEHARVLQKRRAIAPR